MCNYQHVLIDNLLSLLLTIASLHDSFWAEGVHRSASADDSQLGELQLCEDKPEIKFSQKTTYTHKKSVTQCSRVNSIEV